MNRFLKYTTLSLLFITIISAIIILYCYQQPEYAASIGDNREDDKKIVELNIAKQSVKNFIVNPEANVVFVRNESFAMGDYYSFSVDGNYYNVNMRTGIVEQAYFNIPPEKNLNVSEDAAKEIGLAYLKQKCPNLTQTNLSLIKIHQDILHSPVP